MATRPELTRASPPPRCPRCGYDLAGVVTTWTVSCPLELTCSECGLECECGDVFGAGRRIIPWLYEHAAHFWRLDKAIGTALRALAPWWFWKRVGVRTRPAPARLILFVGAAMLAPHLALAALALALGALIVLTPAIAPPPSVMVFPTAAADPDASVRLTANNTLQIETLAGAAEIVLPRLGAPTPIYLTPIGSVLIADARTESAWKPGVPPSSEYIVIVRRIPPTLPASPEATCLAAIRLGGPPSAWRTWDRPDVRLDPLARALLGFVLAAAAVVLVCPSEWRSLRVRRIHLLRICAYATAPLAAWWLFIAGIRAALWAAAAANHFGLPAFENWIGRRLSALDDSALSGRVPWAPLAALGVWLLGYWWFALARGLELRRPVRLWSLVAIAAVLGASIGGATMYLKVSP